MLTLIAGCATKADYNYVNEAKKYGNKGFAEILNGDGTLAKNNFHRSTQILSSGVKEHALKAHNRARWQSGFNNALVWQHKLAWQSLQQSPAPALISNKVMQ
jgi:hypothetical protein